MHTRLDLATARHKHRDLGTVAEAAEPGTTRRAFCLIGVLVFAKALVLVGRELSINVWTLPAFLWQDLLLVLCVAVLDAVVRRPVFGWTCYGAIVGYTAINVPIVRVLSTPLTWPMLRATSGTLSDSIEHHVTTTNVAMLLAVIAAGIALPFVTRRFPPRRLRLAGAALLPLIPLGAWAVTQVDTHGLHRNSLLALANTAVPRVAAEASDQDEWRRSPYLQPDVEPLHEFRGIAHDHNVILVVLESAGAQCLRSYGADEDPMPTLTQLSQRAIQFENAYAVYPESIKGLVAILSSVPPAIDTKAGQYENYRTHSLATELRRDGYDTALFHSGRFMYLGMNSVIRNRGYDVLEDAGHISGEHNSSFGVDEPSTVLRMLSWIDDRQGERFFITYMPIAGHHPYDTPAPGPFPEDRQIDQYRNALHYSDAAIGQLVAGLKQRGLDENTLLVIVGDHGQAFGQHEGNYGHTFFLYEENVRIPLMFVHPQIERPVRVRRVASAVDVAPTVLDLLGRQIADEFRGHSLLKPQRRMALFFTDYSLAIVGLRDNGWKFIHELESGRSRLFDLASDPGEKVNLAAEHPRRVDAYRARLQHWCAAQRANVVGQ